MTTVEIQAIADRVLSARLTPLGLDRVEVTLDRDAADTPTLIVEAMMKPGVSSVGGKVVSAAHGELSQSLLSAGEERFPYLRVRYPDAEAAVEHEPENG
ncbi:hypothetical protein [Methylobacterium sp. sgz302541]|uniref:hypothetical protein n=1 Tax=unclassified Methylobacterium TaxID=2615210 RepID=UPI003D341E98